jgi:hypothetical protein
MDKLLQNPLKNNNVWTPRARPRAARKFTSHKLYINVFKKPYTMYGIKKNPFHQRFVKLTNCCIIIEYHEYITIREAKYEFCL